MTTPALAATGRWTRTGDLPTAASWYGQYDGAVLLRSGKVLLVGGADGRGAPVAATALYDPAAARWTAGAPLRSPRRLHTVTRLDDGRVLVAGGTGGASPLSPSPATAELYDPVTDTWSRAGDLREARRGHSAVLLENGKVLVAGGVAAGSRDPADGLRSVELYDPATDAWSPAAPMARARTGHSAVRFTGGRVIVCGGAVPPARTGETALGPCELYTPATDSWAPTGSLLEPRSDHQTVPVTHTAALVVGGATPGAPEDGAHDPYGTLTTERYELATGLWTALPPMPGGRGAHRVVPLGPTTFLLIGGTADVHDNVGYQSALILDSAARTWTPAAGSLTGRWAFAAVALADGRVLVTGGTVHSGLAAADPDTDELTATTEIFTIGGP
ncbi:Kelch repeat-containing protein [Streptomyces sp. NPDC020965]|uniref:Kelch repeat-containing protein n=1 Tax=Streptomyces sp. NPDC020965 TaxID=3365105 RepID=UPI003794A970